MFGKISTAFDSVSHVWFLLRRIVNVVLQQRVWCCASGAPCTATQTTASFQNYDHCVCAFSILVLRIWRFMHCYPNHCIIPYFKSQHVCILNIIPQQRVWCCASGAVCILNAGAAHRVLRSLLPKPLHHSKIIILACAHSQCRSCAHGAQFAAIHTLFHSILFITACVQINIVLQQRVCAVCILNVGAAHRVLHLLLPKPQHHSKIMILACVHSRYWCCAFVLNLLLSIPLLLYQSILLITACAHSQCQSCASGAQFAAIHTLYQSILLITACVHSQCQSCASGAQFAAIHTLFHSILFITACAHFQCCIAAACWCCTSGAHSPLLSPAAAPHQSHAQVCVCVCVGVGVGVGVGVRVCMCVHVCVHVLGSSHC